jgi:DNA-binding transcriptional MerR regulator
MNSEEFDRSTSDIAREAGCQADTVRLYADLGLIECKRLANGTRLLRKSAGAEVKAIREKRMANRGQRAV